MLSKSELRLQIIEQRKNKVIDCTKLKFANIDKDAFFFTLKSYQTICIYESTKTEPPTNLIIKYLLKINKKVMVPTSTKNDANGFVYLDKSGEKQEKADLKDANIIFVPALAISKNLDRLGKGAAFYDKALDDKDKNTPVFALIFEDELLEDLPIEQHDKKVDGYFLIKN